MNESKNRGTVLTLRIPEWDSLDWAQSWQESRTKHIEGGKENPEKGIRQKLNDKETFIKGEYQFRYDETHKYYIWEQKEDSAPKLNQIPVYSQNSTIPAEEISVVPKYIPIKIFYPSEIDNDLLNEIAVTPRRKQFLRDLGNTKLKYTFKDGSYTIFEKDDSGKHKQKSYDKKGEIIKTNVNEDYKLVDPSEAVEWIKIYLSDPVISEEFIQTGQGELIGASAGILFKLMQKSGQIKTISNQQTLKSALKQTDEGFLYSDSITFGISNIKRNISKDEKENSDENVERKIILTSQILFSNQDGKLHSGTSPLTLTIPENEHELLKNTVSDLRESGISFDIQVDTELSQWEHMDWTAVWQGTQSYQEIEEKKPQKLNDFLLDLGRGGYKFFNEDGSYTQFKDDNSEGPYHYTQRDYDKEGKPINGEDGVKVDSTKARRWLENYFSDPVINDAVTHNAYQGHFSTRSLRTLNDIIENFSKTLTGFSQSNDIKLQRHFRKTSNGILYSDEITFYRGKEIVDVTNRSEPEEKAKLKFEVLFSSKNGELAYKTTPLTISGSNSTEAPPNIVRDLEQSGIFINENSTLTVKPSQYSFILGEFKRLFPEKMAELERSKNNKITIDKLHSYLVKNHQKLNTEQKSLYDVIRSYVQYYYDQSISESEFKLKSMLYQYDAPAFKADKKERRLGYLRQLTEHVSVPGNEGEKITPEIQTFYDRVYQTAHNYYSGKIGTYDYIQQLKAHNESHNKPSFLEWIARLFGYRTARLARYEHFEYVTHNIEKPYVTRKQEKTEEIKGELERKGVILEQNENELSLDEESFELIEKLGSAQYKSGDHQSALATYSKALTQLCNLENEQSELTQKIADLQSTSEEINEYYKKSVIPNEQDEEFNKFKWQYEKVLEFINGNNRTSKDLDELKKQIGDPQLLYEIKLVKENLDSNEFRESVSSYYELKLKTAFSTWLVKQEDDFNATKQKDQSPDYMRLMQSYLKTKQEIKELKQQIISEVHRNKQELQSIEATTTERHYNHHNFLRRMTEELDAEKVESNDLTDYMEQKWFGSGPSKRKAEDPDQADQPAQKAQKK